MRGRKTRLENPPSCSSNFTTLLAPAILFTVFRAPVAQACRPTTLAIRYPSDLSVYKNAVTIDFVVNSWYEGQMIMDRFPFTEHCSRDGIFCVQGSFWSQTGTPWLSLRYQNVVRGYPTVSAWVEKNDEWEAVEYWDCV
ncbi:hypothetical protein BGZ74_001748 [Mortierella antarctica]|nr:hypothetical protein BGZ74_001748 [Mortierella antarctica]